jgi:hypothetical protein
MRFLLLPVAALAFAAPSAQGYLPPPRPPDHYEGLPPGLRLTVAEQAAINADIARGDTFETWVTFTNIP